MGNGRPKWIRPVSTQDHGEVPTHLVSHINTLAILEMDILNYVPQGHQSENALFDEDSIREVGRFPISGLTGLIETTRPQVFGNNGKAVAEKHIERLDHSLILVRTTDFKVFEKPNEYKPGTTQVRLAFSYKNIPYEFTVTDPIFSQNFRNNHRYVDSIDEMFLTLSIAVKWQDWYHKLVAGVIHSS